MKTNNSMREIKFKAVMQRLDSVKYVSQAYSTDNNLAYLFDFENNRWDIFLEMITTEERFVELFPDDDEHLKGWTHIENIQYTGLKDKNGKEIYEGDIVNIRSGEYCQGYWEIDEIFEVAYCLYGFLLKNKDYKENFWIAKEIEVIGNIYENPELLKEINDSI